MSMTRKEVACEKEVQLIKQIKAYEKVLVAFSGGVDSTYLLAVAQEALGQNCQAVFARGPMISAQEEQEALALVEKYHFPVKMIDVDILGLQEFRNNPPNRCYHCKKKLFETFIEWNTSKDNSVIIEGTNASDAHDFRPGRIALQELGINSPLLEVGLTKDEIRILSKLRDLPTWNKPSMACLASRVPYGDEINGDILKRIANAEAILQQKGYPECRVRVHSEIARIEIPTASFAKCIQDHAEITAPLLELGFRFVTLDLMGLRSGSLNPT